MLRLGSFKPCATHRPRMFSVWKLVLLSGSTSARTVAARARVSSVLSRMAAIFFRAGNMGAVPRASMAASSMKAR
ncbi:hypothetical protein D9M68_970820 [compost metagenome]